MDKTIYKQNVLKTLPKIKNLIYLSEPALIGLPKLSFIDYDYNEEEGLTMVLIQVSFSVETDPMLKEIVDHLNEIENKLTNIMNKVSFDENGNLFSAKVGKGLINTGTALVSKLNFSHRSEEIELELDFMFG
jgi:hypothetical protein